MPHIMSGYKLMYEDSPGMGPVSPTCPALREPLRSAPNLPMLIHFPRFCLLGVTTLMNGWELWAGKCIETSSRMPNLSLLGELDATCS